MDKIFLHCQIAAVDFIYVILPSVGGKGYNVCGASFLQLCRLIVPHQCNPTIYCVILLIGEAQFFCFLFYNLVFYLLLGFFVCFFYYVIH